ncbi:hypothetical protein MNBD_GAMMA01-1102 [hydrothermal vent metagenome]|uniref:Uncharacterized protein n=1 Tax=hydrothermal vent metagenome TaxID=652676 RepID=A0A3B0WFC9_9ZZZZ
MKKQSDLLQFITPIVVNNGRYFINDMFQRKFNTDAPETTNHLIAFYNKGDSFIPVSYLSFLPYKNIVLVGGGMTDGQAIRQMSVEEREIISQNNGILYFMLKYGFEYFAQQGDAYFGRVNDPRSLEVDLAAGFEETQYQYILAHYHKPISQWRKRKLEKMISKIGAF